MSMHPGAIGPAQLVTPPTLWQVLRRSWLPVLVVSVLVGAAVGMLSSTRVPVYESAGIVRLAAPGSSPLDGGSGSSRDLERHILDELERFRSPSVLEQTAALMGEGWTVGRIRDALAVRADSASSYIRVSASASRPEEAGQLVSRHVRAYEEAVVAEVTQDAEAATEQIDQYAAQLAARVDGLRTDLDARRADIEAAMPPLEPTEYTRELDRRLSLDPTHQALSRQLSAATSELEALQSEVVRIRLAATVAGSGVEDFESLRTSTDPVSPAPLRDGLLAGVVNFALLAAILWARAAREPAKLESPQTAMALRAPLLGHLPRHVTPQTVVGENDRLAREIEQILAAVQFELTVRPSVFTMVTGLGRDVGATTTVLQVGVRAGRQGRGVLLVDGDLRQRELTRTLGFEGREGWSDLGAGTATVSECIRRVWVDGVDVAVVPAGTRADLRSHPTGDALDGIMAELARYEIVLIDTAPLLVAAETSLAARGADNLLVVVPPACELTTVQGAMSRIAVIDRPVVGLVAGRDRTTSVWSRLRQRLGPSHDVQVKVPLENRLTVARTTDAQGFRRRSRVEARTRDRAAGAPEGS